MVKSIKGVQMDAYVSHVVKWLTRNRPRSVLDPELLLVYGERGCGKSRVVSLACEEVESEFGPGMAWYSLHGLHSVSDMRRAMDTGCFNHCQGLQKYALVLDGVEADVLLDFVRSERDNLIGCSGGWLLVVITSTFADFEAVQSYLKGGLRIKRLGELGDVQRLLRQKASPGLEMAPKGSRRILEACDGFPLAISILGGLASAAGGRDILASEQLLSTLQQHQTQHHDPLQTAFLRVGYDALQEDVKQCFLYTCLMFPLNQVLSRTKLARTWVAEGLVANEAGAEQWIAQLVLRNLLEKAGGVRGGDSADVLVLQPMRNFAISLASPSYYTNDCGDHYNVVQSKVNRASIMLDGTKVTVSFAAKFKNLKILHVWGATNCKRPLPPEHANQEPLSALSGLKNLVHLLLSAAYNGETIKSVKRGSFPQLQHLCIMHFPNLNRWKRIEAGAMPNLQSLTLTHCPRLRRQPPEGIGNNVALTWDD